jgi:hypothetical protein
MESSTGMPMIRLHDCRHSAASIILSHGIPPIVVAGMLGCWDAGALLGVPWRSLAILMTTYTHFIPQTQDEVARLMDNIQTTIPIDRQSRKP